MVGVVDAEGSKIYSAGRTVGGSNFKKTQPGLGREVDGDTIFAIASITKVFTALLLQEMADRGELDLDDSIENFLPSSVTVPSKNGKKITLSHLVTHRSGLPRLPDNFKPKEKDNPYADYTVEMLYAFLSKHELAREPGEKYEYSNRV